MHPSKKRQLLKKEAGVAAAIKNVLDDLQKGLPVAEDQSSLKAYLTRVREVNSQAGFLAWDPDKLKADPISDPGIQYPRLRPITESAPRIFISYRWAQDDGWNSYETDLWVDAFAGSLFGRGYNIYFDKDPRNLDKLVDWMTVLRRMSDCNYFVPVLTDDYIKRVTDPKARGTLVAEWKHALMMYPDFLSFIGIRFSNLKLPKPLTTKNTIDVRKDGSPWGDPIMAVFPSGGLPVPPPPNRPPDPPHWPKYVPY